MFSKKTTPSTSDTKSSSKRNSSNSVPTLVARDTHIVGNLTSNGTMDIDGRIEGNVHCETATVRRNGHIKGDLIADSVFIHGQVQGLIRARSVNFFAGCRVEGVIHHETIAIEDGAFVDGRFKRSDGAGFDESKDDAQEKDADNLNPFAHISNVPTFFEEEENDEEEVKEEAASPFQASTPPLRGTKQVRMLDKLKLISDSNS